MLSPKHPLIRSAARWILWTIAVVSITLLLVCCTWTLSSRLDVHQQHPASRPSS
jgi:hypothetical protein